MRLLERLLNGTESDDNDDNNNKRGDSDEGIEEGEMATNGEIKSIYYGGGF